MIDVTNVIQNSHITTVVEAFYKLLKISGSIKTLLLGGKEIGKHLSLDFCQALGENKTIEHLNIDFPDTGSSSSSIQTTSSVLQYLAKACAMNKRKNGSLSYLSMRNSNMSGTYLNQYFLKCFRISEKDHEEWYGEKKVAAEMKHDQLDRKLHFGLKHLDFSSCYYGASRFKVKNFEILNDPKWPELIQFIGETDLPVLNFRQSAINVHNIEEITCAIGKNPVSPCNKLRVLNLAKNSITQQGAKLLAPALEVNKSIEFLDVSQNALGVYGVVLIARALQKNSTLKGLNLFKNTLDVDGARALREMLKVNSTIEFLDIGHNRIRSKGLEAISEGILEAKDSKLKTLGLRMNFINDDGFQRFFDEVILSGMSKIDSLFINQNNLTDFKAIRLQKALTDQNMKIYVDSFEKLFRQSEDRMKRTIWFGPIAPGNYESAVARLNMIKQFNIAKTGLFK